MENQIQNASSETSYVIGNCEFTVHREFSQKNSVSDLMKEIISTNNKSYFIEN